MNSAKSFLLGLVASLLNAAGFAHVANRIDSLIQGQDYAPADGMLVSVEPCVIPCAVPASDL